jgi:hypothetical protein
MIQVGRRPYSIGNNARLVPYDPDSIDLFFIVDGDLSLYLIPSRVIGGRVGLLLRTYSKRVIRNSPVRAFVDPHLIVSKVLISARRA